SCWATVESSLVMPSIATGNTCRKKSRASLSLVMGVYPIHCGKTFRQECLPRQTRPCLDVEQSGPWETRLYEPPRIHGSTHPRNGGRLDGHGNLHSDRPRHFPASPSPRESLADRCSLNTYASEL